MIEFLRDCCEPAGDVKSAELYAAYEEWAFRTRHRPVSSTRFPRDLIAAGAHFGKTIIRKRVQAGSLFIGVRLGQVVPWEKEK